MIAKKGPDVSPDLSAPSIWLTFDGTREVAGGLVPE
jgi:hypothetical protein